MIINKGSLKGKLSELYLKQLTTEEVNTLSRKVVKLLKNIE